LEHLFHGTPSGIDTALSIHRGVHALLPVTGGLPELRPVTLPHGHLVIGAIPRARSTAELVAEVGRRRAADPDGTAAILDRLGAIAGEVAESPPTIGQLGALANEAHGLLASLGVSTPETDLATTYLVEHGALGAKLSGAGGGGAFYGFFGEAATARTCADRLRVWLQKKDLTVAGKVHCEIMEIGAP
jgi:mevalonate kinase